MSLFRELWHGFQILHVSGKHDFTKRETAEGRGKNCFTRRRGDAERGKRGGENSWNYGQKKRCVEFSENDEFFYIACGGETRSKKILTGFGAHSELKSGFEIRGVSLDFDG